MKCPRGWRVAAPAVVGVVAVCRLCHRSGQQDGCVPRLEGAKPVVEGPSVCLVLQVLSHHGTWAGVTPTPRLTEGRQRQANRGQCQATAGMLSPVPRQMSVQGVALGGEGMRLLIEQMF